MKSMKKLTIIPTRDPVRVAIVRHMPGCKPMLHDVYEIKDADKMSASMLDDVINTIIEEMVKKLKKEYQEFEIAEFTSYRFDHIQMVEVTDVEENKDGAL